MDVGAGVVGMGTFIIIASIAIIIVVTITTII